MGYKQYFEAEYMPKENTVCSFFNLHVRKLSNGPMNLS